jgi:hypothetical protein
VGSLEGRFLLSKRVPLASARPSKLVEVLEESPKFHIQQFISVAEKPAPHADILLCFSARPLARPGNSS